MGTRPLARATQYPARPRHAQGGRVRRWDHNRAPQGWAIRAAR
jgi:hypothetical protein